MRAPNLPGCLIGGAPLFCLRVVAAPSAERSDLGPLWKFMPSDKLFKKHLGYINGYCKDVMKARLQESKEQLRQRPDMLSKILLSSKDEGKQVDEAEVVDFLKNFMIAGRDTTAELLTWTVYMLSKHPEVEAAVLAEIQTVVGDQPLTMDVIQNLRYLKCVLQEVLRLFPPGNIPTTSHIALLSLVHVRHSQ
jgi:cytochrome P450